MAIDSPVRLYRWPIVRDDDSSRSLQTSINGVGVKAEERKRREDKKAGFSLSAQFGPVGNASPVPTTLNLHTVNISFCDHKPLHHIASLCPQFALHWLPGETINHQPSFVAIALDTVAETKKESNQSRDSREPD